MPFKTVFEFDVSIKKLKNTIEFMNVRLLFGCRVLCGVVSILDVFILCACASTYVCERCACQYSQCTYMEYHFFVSYSFVCGIHPLQWPYYTRILYNPQRKRDFFPLIPISLALIWSNDKTHKWKQKCLNSQVLTFYDSSVQFHGSINTRST